MCDAEPAALAKYVLALVKKEKSENELREYCLDQLEVFFLKGTKQFEDLLFQTLKTKSYLYKTDNSKSLSNTESLNNITVNSAKKLNSCDGREGTDKKDSIKPENVPKSKSSHFSSLRTHTKVSGCVSRENHGRVQTEEINKIVEDYEWKLEKCKKERLLRQRKVDVPAAAVEPEFTELTPKMEAVIDNVLHTGAQTDISSRTIGNNNLVAAVILTHRYRQLWLPFKERASLL